MIPVLSTFVHHILSFRLTPLYGLLLAFYIGIFPYLKKGPYQDLTGMDSENNCRDYWHFNILYVNNVVKHSLSKVVRTCQQRCPILAVQNGKNIDIVKDSLQKMVRILSQGR